MKERIKWIDGLKGIACFGVFLTHFFGVFYLWVERQDISLSAICRLLLDYPLKILINGNFMVAIFCILSGYLVASARVTTFKGLLKAMCKRYLRLSIPIFGFCILVYICEAIWGFHNQEVGLLLNNTWLSGYYKNSVDIRDVLMIPFFRLWLFSDNSINGTFWMLKSLFISTMMVLVVKYICIRYYRLRGMAIFSLLLVSLKTPIYFGCIMGYVIFVLANNANFESYLCKYRGRGKKLRLPLIILALGTVWILPQWGGINEYIITLCAGICIICIMFYKKIQMWLSNDILVRLGDISFAIYGIHWPIICSLGLQLFLYLYPAFSYTAAVMIDFVFVTGIIIGVSKLYQNYIEKNCYTLINKILRDKHKTVV